MRVYDAYGHPWPPRRRPFFTPSRIIASATVAGVLTSIALWIVTCRYERITSLSFQASVAPYVFPEIPKSVVKADANRIEATVAFINTGHGPALNLITSNKLTIRRPRPWSPTSHFTNRLWGKTLLAPNTNENATFAVQPGLPLVRITSGLDHVEVVLKLQYDSVNGHHYRTWKQYKYHAATNIWDNIDGRYYDCGCKHRADCE